HCGDDVYFFFFSSRRRHTRSKRDWSSDVCSSDLRSPCPRSTTCPARTLCGRSRLRLRSLDDRLTAAAVTVPGSRWPSLVLGATLKKRRTLLLEEVSMFDTDAELAAVTRHVRRDPLTVTVLLRRDLRAAHDVV